MKLYRLKLAEGVKEAIQRLPGNIRQRVKRLLDALRRNPKPDIATELRGELTGRYRIRLGHWRVVYHVDDEVITVTVLKVGMKEGPEFYHDLD
ncbi:MAG: type II toxin-antitoxin system RelE/ParE family toxin [Caldilineaceae bacterium]